MILAWKQARPNGKWRGQLDSRLHSGRALEIVRITCLAQGILAPMRTPPASSTLHALLAITIAVLPMGAHAVSTAGAERPPPSSVHLASRNTQAATWNHEDWLREAQRLERAQEWQGLLDLGRAWYRSDGRSAMAWYVQGRALGELKRYADAISAYLQALRVNPEDVYSLNNLGNAYRQIGRFEDAFLAYREAVRIYPDCVRAWHNMGVTYYTLKGQAGIAEALKLAEEINPDIARAWQEVLQKYTRGSDEQVAMEAVRTLGRQNPDDLNKLFDLLLSRLQN